MENDILQWIDAARELRVAVLGETMLDGYLVGQARRLCQEAPVPIVAVDAYEHVPGGAANVAVNVAALGADVAFLSVTGADEDGEKVRQALRQRGVGTSLIEEETSRRTLSKRRLLSEGQMIVRFDQGDVHQVGRRTEQRLLRRLQDVWEECDAVVISDYGYGVVTSRVVEALRQLQSDRPRTLVVDSKRLPAFRDVGVTAVKPNFRETMHLLGSCEPAEGAARADAVADRGERILELTGATLAAVTLDRDGAVFLERGRPCYRTYARSAPNTRAAGAGDTFVSTLALALAAGAPTPEAAELASAAAEVVTARDGTSACLAGELREVFAAPGKFFPSAEALAPRAAFHRDQGQRVVVTNGCFDILHRGHVTYLSRAKAQGDVLVVGVNTDEGIRRLKGDERPINRLEDRVRVLEALSCVDYVVPFGEDTPCRLVERLKPDVFVKGGDYTRDDLPEAAIVERLGGEVRILPFLTDRSTTGIIERIRGNGSPKAQPVH